MVFSKKLLYLERMGHRKHENSQWSVCYRHTYSTQCLLKGKERQYLVFKCSVCSVLPPSNLYGITNLQKHPSYSSPAPPPTPNQSSIHSLICWAKQWTSWWTCREEQSLSWRKGAKGQGKGYRWSRNEQCCFFIKKNVNLSWESTWIPIAVR